MKYFYKVWFRCFVKITSAKASNLSYAYENIIWKISMKVYLNIVSDYLFIDL